MTAGQACCLLGGHAVSPLFFRVEVSSIFLFTPEV